MLPLHQSSVSDFLHYLLKAVRFRWWGRRDSNSHTLRRWNLNPVRLPISPRPQWLCIL